MSKSDLPPSYGDWPGHQGGSHPLPPPYPPPAYEGHDQPPPYQHHPESYTLGPQPAHPTPYPGQAGEYPLPAWQSWGQGHQTPGISHIMVPPMPPMTLTAQPNSGDSEGFRSAVGSWDSTAVRHSFVRKVYLILAAQLFVTVSIVAVFIFVIPVREFVVRNPGVYWASYAVYLVCYLTLACFEGPRRRFPANLIFLAIFTLALSYMTGAISSYHGTEAVFLALGITMIVCLIVTVFCFQTKVDFTACSGVFCMLGMVFIVTGIIMVIVLSFEYIPWIHMLYAAIGAIVFTLFFAFHTQLLIGNRKHSISPEEHVFAALSIYLDVIQMFLFLLQVTVGSSSGD